MNIPSASADIPICFRGLGEIEMEIASVSKTLQLKSSR